MAKALKYLLVTNWAAIVFLPAAAAVVLLLCILSGVPGGADNLFSTYFASMPSLLIIVLFVFGCTLSSSTLHVALSFGCRRKDYFLALQGIVVIYAAVAWAIHLILCRLPALLPWTEQFQFMARMLNTRFWLYPLLALGMTFLGCLCGLVFTRSRRVAVLLYALSFGVMIGVTTSLAIAWMGETNGEISPAQSPFILAAAAITVGIVILAEVLLGRFIRRYCVK